MIDDLVSKQSIIKTDYNKTSSMIVNNNIYDTQKDYFLTDLCN